MTMELPFDGLDIGYCSRCGADMSGEPPAANWCGDCVADEENELEALRCEANNGL